MHACLCQQATFWVIRWASLARLFRVVCQCNGYTDIVHRVVLSLLAGKCMLAMCPNPTLGTLPGSGALTMRMHVCQHGTFWVIRWARITGMSGA